MNDPRLEERERVLEIGDLVMSGNMDASYFWAEFLRPAIVSGAPLPEASRESGSWGRWWAQ